MNTHHSSTLQPVFLSPLFPSFGKKKSSTTSYSLVTFFGSRANTTHRSPHISVLSRFHNFQGKVQFLFYASINRCQSKPDAQQKSGQYSTDYKIIPKYSFLIMRIFYTKYADSVDTLAFRINMRVESMCQNQEPFCNNMQKLLDVADIRFQVMAVAPCDPALCHPSRFILYVWTEMDGNCISGNILRQARW